MEQPPLFNLDIKLTFFWYVIFTLSSENKIWRITRYNKAATDREKNKILKKKKLATLLNILQLRTKQKYSSILCVRRGNN